MKTVLQLSQGGTVNYGPDSTLTNVPRIMTKTDVYIKYNKTFCTFHRHVSG